MLQIIIFQLSVILWAISSHASCTASKLAGKALAVLFVVWAIAQGAQMSR